MKALTSANSTGAGKTENAHSGRLVGESTWAIAQSRKSKISVTFFRD